MTKKRKNAKSSKSPKSNHAGGPEATSEGSDRNAPRLSEEPKAHPAAKGDTKKAPKPKPEPEGELVVFAFRLAPEERDLIHQAAGPARASKFVRALAVAAACHDEAAIKLLLQSTKPAA
jgi:hypothetical protein